jgi:hypothetical protein
MLEKAVKDGHTIKSQIFLVAGDTTICTRTQNVAKMTY